MFVRLALPPFEDLHADLASLQLGALAQGLDRGLVLDERRDWLEVLDELARLNQHLIAQGEVPPLYGSGTRYQREEGELWQSAWNAWQAGHGDCEDLAAWRVGELRALGWRALLPGDEGRAEARRRDLTTLPARVVLQPQGDGVHHAVVEYTVNRRTYFDDPSARLGMLFEIDDAVLDAERRNKEFIMPSVSGRPLSSLKAWSRPAEVGPLQVRAARGHRAAVQQLEEGVYLVKVFPSGAPQIGSAALTAAMTTAALKALLARAGTSLSTREGRSDLREGVADNRILELVRRLRDRPARPERQVRLPGPVQIGCRCDVA